MVKCINCGFCAFYIDLLDGLRWREMDRDVRQALLEGRKYNPRGQNPGTGHWNYLRCAKYLQEWTTWNNGAPSHEALTETLTKERDCNGFAEHKAGLTPQEYPTFQQPDASGTREKLEYDVFLSHSSLDDNLCKDITVLLENSGLRVFATPASIPTGKWEEQIERALQGVSTIWVLLTPNAMEQSVWTHHEFGYFFGFRHGKSVDPGGHSCRFLYSDPSYLKGLYGHIQGTQVLSFEDPIALARVITSALGHDLSIPKGWVPRRYPPAAPTTLNPPRLGRLSPGSQAGPNNSRLIELTIVEPQDRLYDLGLLAFHPEAEITLERPIPFVGPSLNSAFHIQVTWRAQRMEPVPTEATDHAGRTFDVGSGPRQPSGTWPMLITMDTDDGRRLAGIVYYRLGRHPGNLPDLNVDPPVFLDWRQAKRA